MRFGAKGVDKNCSVDPHLRLHVCPCEVQGNRPQDFGLKSIQGFCLRVRSSPSPERLRFSPGNIVRPKGNANSIPPLYHPEPPFAGCKLANWLAKSPSVRT